MDGLPSPMTGIRDCTFARLYVSPMDFGRSSIGQCTPHDGSHAGWSGVGGSGACLLRSLNAYFYTELYMTNLFCGFTSFDQIKNTRKPFLSSVRPEVESRAKLTLPGASKRPDRRWRKKTNRRKRLTAGRKTRNKKNR